MEQLALLRSTSQRLNTTPIQHLPRIAGFLSDSIACCGPLLQLSENNSTESSVTVHRLKTRITALLQERSCAGRFTAAVLIKSYIENSGPSASGLWETWGRGLLTCLNKPDPVDVKEVYLIALLRIFLLSQEIPSLQREVTTPLLPPFLTISLTIIKPISSSDGTNTQPSTNPLLPSVLRSWDELLQKNGPTFRPFAARIRSICLGLLSDMRSSESVSKLARQVITALQQCAPKGMISAEWEQTVSHIIDAAHDAADRVFRSVLEEWLSNSGAKVKSTQIQDYSRAPENAAVDTAGLGAWNGVLHGSRRITVLLALLRELLNCAAQSVALPVGLILDLTSRILNITIPRVGAMNAQALRPNPEVHRDERDELWACIPRLHSEALKLLAKMMAHLRHLVRPVCLEIGNQILTTFESENWLESIRAESYCAIGTLLQTCQTSCAQLDRAAFASLCRHCCLDLSLSIHSTQEAMSIDNNRNGNGAIVPSKHPNNEHLPPGSGVGAQNSRQRRTTAAASELLPKLMRCLTALKLPHSLRAEVERTSIMTQNQKAMLASVMNPSQTQPGQRKIPSIVPFLARASRHSTDVELLLRPRMPLQAGQRTERTEEQDDLDHFGKDEPAQHEQQTLPTKSQGFLEEEDGHGSYKSAMAWVQSAPFTELKVNPDSGELSSQKRAFAAMQGDEQASDGAVKTATDSTNAIKKSRTEEEDVRRDLNPLAKDEQGLKLAGSQPTQAELSTATAVVRELEVPDSQFSFAETNTAVHDTRPGVPLATAAETSNNNNNNDDDSDSDSEIPAIDPSLATDDEDEDDEDDEIE